MSYFPPHLFSQICCVFFFFIVKCRGKDIHKQNTHNLFAFLAWHMASVACTSEEISLKSDILNQLSAAVISDCHALHLFENGIESFELVQLA